MSEPALHIRVLFADEDLLAVDKPAGLHTAPLRSGEAGSLLAQVIALHPEIAGVPGIKPVEPGLLHRLDRDTSGVVLIARNPASFRNLLAQFRAGEVRKEYLAVCVPRSAARSGTRLQVSSRFAPFGPGRRKVRLVPLDGEAGRSTLRATAAAYHTEAEVLEVRGDLALVRAVITRGFRHQVRAHLAHLGLPIAGDPLYGAAPPSGAPARLCLHAAAVELRRPGSGEPLRIESPLPPAFPLCYGGASGEVT